jgi:spermidine/putrescine transport system ATP-binding protein
MERQTATARATASTGASSHIVELDSVTKMYDDVVAVDDVTLTVPEGEFLTLLGPSGCGKTTTLRMISGFERPTSGEVRIQGKDVGPLPPHRRDTAMVFQEYALFPHMSVEDNVGFGLKMRGQKRARRRHRVDEILELVGLPGLGDRYPSQLSGGQRQRVALARAIIMEPAVLLLDEPLGALDAQLRRDMQLELRHMHEQLNVTFVYVTHDQEEALTMSDRVVIMRGGMVEQQGRPGEVYDRPASTFVATFLGECNLLPGVVADRGSDITVVDVPSVGKVAGTAAPGHELAIGDEVYLAVRPEWVELSQDEAIPEGHEGRVVDQIFTGPSTRVILRLADQHEFAVRLAGRTSLSLDGLVNVAWTRDQAVVLPR